jgi:dihydroxyacetone kinase-like predicted kinase
MGDGVYPLELEEVSMPQFCRIINAGAELYEGRRNLRHILDSINFFPVIDKDTGKNVTPLIQAFKLSEPYSRLEDAVVSLRENIRKKGRGYSGVFMHRFFSGFLDRLSVARRLSTSEFAEGFINGYEATIRGAADPPVIEEGTIVGAMKAVADTARKYAGNKTRHVREFFQEAYLAAVQYVKETPEKLKVKKLTDKGELSLAELGIVDSGALAFYYWLSGLAKGAGVPIDEELFTEFQPVDAVDEGDMRYCIEVFVDLERAGPNTINVQGIEVDFQTLEEQLFMRYGGNARIEDVSGSPYLHLHGHYPEDRSKSLAEQLSELGRISELKVDDMHEQSKA